MSKEREKVTFICNRKIKEKLQAWCPKHDRSISYLCERVIIEALPMLDEEGKDILQTG